jgi:hypothetical protein
VPAHGGWVMRERPKHGKTTPARSPEPSVQACGAHDDARGQAKRSCCTAKHVACCPGGECVRAWVGGTQCATSCVSFSFAKERAVRQCGGTERPLRGEARLCREEVPSVPAKGAQLGSAAVAAAGDHRTQRRVIQMRPHRAAHLLRGVGFGSARATGWLLFLGFLGGALWGPGAGPFAVGSFFVIALLAALS